jgi:predicted nucleic acid-binding protein
MYQLAEAEVQALIEHLHGAEQVIPLPHDQLPLRPRDADDTPLLAVALAGNAAYLVTGDNDLLDLRHDPALATLQIVTIRELLANLEVVGELDAGT